MKPVVRDMFGIACLVLALALASFGQPALAEPLPAQSPPADIQLGCNPADPPQISLQVSVTGIRSTKGNITITLYPDDSAHFLDGKYKLARQEVPVTLPVTQACFALPASGFYAIALYHDENDNHHFDMTMLGLPAEGYGFSNDPTIYLGPPDVSRVRFSVHPGANPITIKMKYY